MSKRTYLQCLSWMTRRQLSRSVHPPPRILRVYTEDFVGFSDVFSLDNLSSTLLSQSFVFKTAVNMEIVGSLYIPRTVEEMRSL